MCSVCDHSRRDEIEAALERDVPLKRVAKLYEVPASSVRDHRDGDHKNARPADPNRPRPRDDPRAAANASNAGPPTNPWPTNAEIAAIDTPVGRRDLLFRYFAERRWKGGRTVALLAYLWRRRLGHRAEEQIAELASEAALRHQRLRGSRHMRREELIARATTIAEKAEKAGKWADSIQALKFVSELDGLSYEPGMLSALVEAQAWRLIRPMLEREAPHLIERIDRTLAGAERRRQRAVRTLEQGASPDEDDDGTPLLPPHAERLREDEAREAERREGLSDTAEADEDGAEPPAEETDESVDESVETAREPAEPPIETSPTNDESAPTGAPSEAFAAPRNSGGRRPRVFVEENEE